MGHDIFVLCLWDKRFLSCSCLYLSYFPWQIFFPLSAKFIPLLIGKCCFLSLDTSNFTEVIIEISHYRKRNKKHYMMLNINRK